MKDLYQSSKQKTFKSSGRAVVAHET